MKMSKFAFGWFVAMGFCAGAIFDGVIKKKSRKMVYKIKLGTPNIKEYNEMVSYICSFSDKLLSQESSFPSDKDRNYSIMIESYDKKTIDTIQRYFGELIGNYEEEKQE